MAGLHLVFGRRVDGTIPKVVPLTFNPGYIELGTRWGGGRTPARSFNGCPFAARNPATRNRQHETASQIPRVYLKTWHALRPRCGERLSIVTSAPAPRPPAGLHDNNENKNKNKNKNNNNNNNKNKKKKKKKKKNKNKNKNKKKNNNNNNKSFTLQHKKNQKQESHSSALRGEALRPSPAPPTRRIFVKAALTLLAHCTAEHRQHHNYPEAAAATSSLSSSSSPQLP